MALTSFDVKRHDLLPALVLTISLDGTAVDLTYASSAKLIVSNRSGVKIDSPMTILDQTNPDNLGKVQYDLQLGDTDTVGSYNMEVEVTWAGGRPQTFPSKGYLKFNVIKDLDNAPEEA